MPTIEKIPVKDHEATVNGAISLALLLEEDETITGTPTIAATPSGLTFSSVQANLQAITVNGASAAIGKAITFSVEGGSQDVLYSCAAYCSTTSSPEQELVIRFKILVE